MIDKILTDKLFSFIMFSILAILIFALIIAITLAYQSEVQYFTINHL